MTRPRPGRLALLEAHVAFVRNDVDEWYVLARCNHVPPSACARCLNVPLIPSPFLCSIILPMSHLERIAKNTRTIMKVPVLELQLKEDGGEQRTLYQFGSANVSEIVAALEEQVKHHRKVE